MGQLSDRLADYKQRRVAATSRLADWRHQRAHLVIDETSFAARRKLRTEIADVEADVEDEAAALADAIAALQPGAKAEDAAHAVRLSNHQAALVFLEEHEALAAKKSTHRRAGLTYSKAWRP